MVEVKTERNQAVMSGKKIKDVAEEFGISSTLVGSIYKKQAKKEERRKNPLYQLLEMHCDDEKLCTGIFTVLTRLNVTTEEEFMKLDRKYLLRYARNCGEVMVNIIEQVQDYIRNEKVSEKIKKTAIEECCLFRRRYFYYGVSKNYI